ncbi:carboxypeptidase regulatory-like domain-containing protein [Sphingomonas sanguinis]|uniref:carboxypeptidase regulatory-like domain-containing protein n=1 Tax=Sphingomonas sanguinis TaxID=33051 RepID=UPI000B2D13B5|nr:carboxypeptidase regulatory-like domain-containing protein [Sphingomonas sanguinis]
MSAMILPALLALAVLVAWVRLGWRQSRAGERSRGWRVALLLLAQPALAVLLYLTLAPPSTRLAEPDVLTVLTRGGTAAGGQTVALPEAGGPRGIEQAPDLATALRRHPGIRRLRIRGEGLEARDRPVAHGLAIAFTPLPLPQGMVAFTPPDRTAPGSVFRVSGQVEGGGSVELLDPAGAKIAAAPLDGEGRFTLEGLARVPGVALFRLRSRGPRGDAVSDTDIPVWTAAEPGLRVTLLGGAPGPEVKFWRRWASDAGLNPVVRVSLGAGLDLGDPMPPLTVSGLAKVDLLILDERSWAGLGAGEWAAVAAAVRGGMGVLLRVTGPVPSGYGAALGLPLSGGVATAPVRLLGRDGKALPTLTRRIARIGAGDTQTLLNDATGAELAAWRALGRGRVGVWLVTDAAGLVTAGHGESYGELWIRMIATLARAGNAPSPRFDPLAHRGERTALCGLEPGDTLVRPNGQAVRLLPDPATLGCAGYWPRVDGWHVLRRGKDAWPFYVRATLPIGLAAAERRDATLALVREGGDMRPAYASSPRPGESWPWLLGFLALAGLVWWFERARFGRGPSL